MSKTTQEIRKAAFKAFIDQAEQDGFSLLDDELNRLVFTGGWDAHAEHTAAIRAKADALVVALTEGEDDYDGLVYYEYAAELAALKTALEVVK